MISSFPLKAKNIALDVADGLVGDILVIVDHALVLAFNLDLFLLLDSDA